MPALEVFDTVVLNTNRSLVGIVDRTHYENNEPLQDILIIAHVNVDLAVLTEFLNTGTPPKNYVFVRFSDEAHGSSLVHENDVTLLDRSFNLGDVVKKEDGHILGTVTNITESYILQPTWFNQQNPDGTLSAITIDKVLHDSSHICSLECPFGVLLDIEHPLQDCLLHDIPGEELKKAEDVLEADWIIQDDWVGVAEELELLVIVLLEDGSVVVVKEPDELYIPVEDLGKPLVSLPEFDNLPRPDLLVAQQGWSATIPPHDFQCGQMIITNHKNLRLGRWLRGQYSPKAKPQGRILDIRTRSIDVKWLTCNAFIPKHPTAIRPPHSRTSLYDNIDTFPNKSELRSNKQVTIYDHNRFPCSIESHTRSAHDNSPGCPTVHSPTDFRIGDQVKFRNQKEATSKYEGRVSAAGLCHAKFDRVALSTTFGFDVNEFKIVSSRQEATVLWQDGTCSKSLSKSLLKFSLFEPELAPADLVVAREGMKQIPCSPREGHGATPGQPVDFNEMRFFENPHDLVPQRVGVVQNINQFERVAQVRWFEEPQVCLTNYGHVLKAESRLGRLSERVEDISLYEIMTFPALMRRLKDLVVIPPNHVSSTTVETMKSCQPHPGFRIGGQAALSHIVAHDDRNQDAYELLQWLLSTALMSISDASLPRVIENGSHKAQNTIDWVGEIIQLGLDGVVTVRLNSRDVCKDVRLEHDQLICMIDDAAIGGIDTSNSTGNIDTDMDMSIDGSDDLDMASTISETVEYEGGERLDTDSGDENWEDADDDEMVVDKMPTPTPSTRIASPSADKVATRGVTELASNTDGGEPVPRNNAQPPKSDPEQSLRSLQLSLPTTEPPSFAILECRPPMDQYREPKDSFPTSPAFLKRVSKEHRILASSLPKAEIYVRTYESRLDLMRCLILGPSDTPYEHAPFLIDLQLGKNFPREPPMAFFHSWTSGLGRINPNLYEEGKICLSLLGTWPGKAETEGWSDRATILQLLVSLQGLVFVRQPFYNEAGFEGYAEDNVYHLEAQRYNEKVYVMARGFIKHAVTTPVQGLEDVLAWTYLPHENHVGLLQQVITRSYGLIEHSERETANEDLVDGTGAKEDQTRVFLRLLSRGAIVMLRKTVRLLESLSTDS